MKKVKQSIETKKQLKKIKREKRRVKKELLIGDSDEYFAFIAGYTEGGAPYGITHEEWEEFEEKEHDKSSKFKKKPSTSRLIENDVLPF